jgi:hypothetical protein
MPGITYREFLKDDDRRWEEDWSAAVGPGSVYVKGGGVVLVCGSRDWTNWEAIRRELERLPAACVIIHGDNGYDADGKPLFGQSDHLAVRGADKLADTIAVELGFEVIPFTPD